MRYESFLDLSWEITTVPQGPGRPCASQRGAPVFAAIGRTIEALHLCPREGLLMKMTSAAGAS